MSASGPFFRFTVHIDPSSGAAMQRRHDLYLAFVATLVALPASSQQGKNPPTNLYIDVSTQNMAGMHPTMKNVPMIISPIVAVWPAPNPNSVMIRGPKV